MFRFFGFVVSILYFGLIGTSFADGGFFEKQDKKSFFEKKTYYSLERVDNLTSAQKESINQSLKTYQAQKDKHVAENIKKFASEPINKSFIKSVANDISESELNSRGQLLESIHKTLNKKQREQFIKKFEGMID